ncbi:hypothetical protein PO909_027467 [Leuciscus waleckii]
MRTAQLLLFFLLVCQTTESLRDKRVNLGENVTLECQIGVKEIYWVFQKLTDSPVLMMRTFTIDSTSAQFYDERLKDKYSSLTLSRLLINNITIDELVIYFCVKTAPTLQLSDGTRLNITEASQDQNQTEVNNNSQSPNTQTPKTDNIMTVTSFILNIVLIIAIIGLLILQLKKPTKSRQHRLNVEPVQLEDFNAAQVRLTLLYNSLDILVHGRHFFSKISC